MPSPTRVVNATAYVTQTGTIDRNSGTYKKWRAYYDKEKKARDNARRASEDAKKVWNILKFGGNIFIVTPLKILAALGAFSRR